MKELLQSIHAQVSDIPLQFITLIVAFVVTVILGFITIPILKKLKIGQVVRDDGPKEHLKKAGTPTMGGIIILITTIISSLIIGMKYDKMIPVALVTLGFGAIGFIDDFKKLVLKNPKGLSPKLKMIGLFIISLCFSLYLVLTNFTTDIYIPIARTYIMLPQWLFVIFTIFVMLACTNSLNLTDGLDGLAGGVTAIIMIFFTYVAMSWGDTAMSTFSSIIAGSTIGFLLFNLYPAKVFMGDTGSLALRRSIL